MTAAVRHHVTAHHQPSSHNSWQAFRGVGCADVIGVRSLHKCRGFTIVEILVTLTIVAILAVIAVPSFNGTIQRARTQSEANSLVNDIQFARGEAIKRGMPVSLCASQDGATCTNANAWHVGWIIFNDDNGSGTLDASTDSVLRYRPRFTSGDTFTATTSSTSSALTYSRDGFAINLPNSGTFKVSLSTTPVNATAARCVTVNMVGRAVQTGGACS
ncbi:GspH/FimT family pseudopilin [Ralstonia pickettii]|nr:GspH/FimT family pseudopilin [Ralstonia pickettii]